MYEDRATERIKGQLASLGIDPNTVDLTGWTDKYYMQGYDAPENRELFQQALIDQYGAGPGDRTNYGEELRKVALANGVRRDEAWFQNAEQRLAGGEMNLEMYEQDFRNEAASRYPLFSEKLAAGENWDIWPWRQAIMDVLGIRLRIF